MPWFFVSPWRVLVLLLVVLLLPTAALTWALVAAVDRSIRTHAQAQNRRAAHLAAELVSEELLGLSRYIEGFASRPQLPADLSAGREGAVTTHLRDLVEGNTKVDRAFISDRVGVLRAVYPPAPDLDGHSFSHRDWFKGAARSNRTYVSEVYRRISIPRRQVVTIVTPISNDVVAYLGAQHSIEGLTGRLAEVPLAGGRIWLIDHHGHLAGHGNDVGEPTTLGDQSLLRAARAGEVLSAAGADPITGSPSFLSVAPVREINWAVISSQPSEAVLAPVTRVGWFAVLWSAICFAVMLSLGFVFASALRRQHLKLIEVDQTKALLAGMVVHDLRNPLTACMAHAELLRASLQGSAPDVLDDVESILMACHRLLVMINALIDVMRMEDSELPVQTGPHDLGVLVRTKVAEYVRVAERSGLTLEVVAPSEAVPGLVDAELVSRIVENLLTNAIKHTPRGGSVQVTLERGVQTAQIAVQDTGEGIAGEHLPLLFKKYGRVRTRKLGTTHDTGLGLVFCRMATEMQGGCISVTSQLGEGSTFTVELPLSQSAIARPSSAAEAQAHGALAVRP